MLLSNWRGDCENLSPLSSENSKNLVLIQTLSLYLYGITIPLLLFPIFLQTQLVIPFPSSTTPTPTKLSPFTGSAQTQLHYHTANQHSLHPSSLLRKVLNSPQHPSVIYFSLIQQLSSSTRSQYLSSLYVLPPIQQVILSCGLLL